MADVPAPPPVVELDLARVWPWAWAPPTWWTCPRCTTEVLTRAAAPRCPACGFVEQLT